MMHRSTNIKLNELTQHSHPVRSFVLHVKPVLGHSHAAYHRGCEASLNPRQSLCILLWDMCTEYSYCKKCHCKPRQIFPDGPVSNNRTIL